MNPTDDKTTQELLEYIVFDHFFSFQIFLIIFFFFFFSARLARELQREEEERQAAEVEAESGTAAQTSRPAETPPTKKNGVTFFNPIVITF